jgi:excisionase family DNA binding protein
LPPQCPAARRAASPSKRKTPTLKPLPGARWVKLIEAAEYAQIPMRTMRDWIAKGWLPAYRIGPRQIQIDLNDVDALRRRIPTVDGS